MSRSDSDVPGVRVSATVTIPAGEIEFRASRSGGPGGQHVNTSSTRVELTWNAARSTALTGEQRALLLATLHAKLDTDGSLRVVVSDTRSQKQNRAIAEERLAATGAERLAASPLVPTSATTSPRRTVNDTSCSTCRSLV